MNAAILRSGYDLSWSRSRSWSRSWSGSWSGSRSRSGSWSRITTSTTYEQDKEHSKKLKHRPPTKEEREELDKGWKELENSGLDKPLDLNEQQPEITDEMIENYIEENTDMYSLDNQEQSDIRKAIKWALSLKAQPSDDKKKREKSYTEKFMGFKTD